MHRLPATLALSVSALIASPAAQALGFGRFAPSATLGQPLDLRIPVNLEAGEQLDTSCVSAEVVAGDSKLSASLVAVSVEIQSGATALRVRSLAPIEELVVEVTVSAGCGARFSRTFTAFPDPPMVVAQATLPSTPAATSEAPGRSLPAAADRPSTAGRPSASPSSSPPANPSASRAVAPQAGAAAVRPRAPARPRAERTAQAAAPASRAAVARAASADRLTLEPLTPRLKLDLSDTWFTGEIAASAVAAAGAGSDPSTEAERLAALQDTLSALQRQGASQRAADAALRERLRLAQARADWTPWLLGAAGLLLLALLAAVWRLRQRPDRAWWQGESLAAAAAPVRSTASDGTRAALYDLDDPDDVPAPENPLPDPAGSALPASPAAAPSPSPVVQPAQDLWLSESPVTLAALADASQRELAIEELLDLEQQTDFFIALGQEESAVEQLMVHLRGTGGASPVPYLELLDIYRRRDDRATYDKVRNRFNRRFNAFLPEWQAGPTEGRLLEDYPDVVKRLQDLWSRPREAMQEIESLLFRREPSGDVFDLPAYRDALMLYALARDMPMDDTAMSANAVDLLLPLGNEPTLETQPGELSLALPVATSPAPPVVDAPSLHLDPLDLQPRRPDGG